MRRCVHCGVSRPKGDLVRIVRTPGGQIRLDETQRQAGRGAYVCPQAGCTDGFLRSKRGASLLGAALTDDLAETLRGACRRVTP
jgi:hypothetical protein